MKQSDKLVSIALFDWIWKNSSSLDFFIVDNYNIHYYKMEDNKFSFKELGTISIDLPYAWFEVNIIKNNIEL